MRIVLYTIYAFVFYIYQLVPVNKHKTTFIMTHDKSKNGNIMRMHRKIKEERPDEVVRFITRENIQDKSKIKRIKSKVKFVAVSSFHLATSHVIFLDNVFLPMAFMKFKKSVKVVQLWHGCNTLKKFGQLSNTGQLKRLEKRANNHYTHVMVSSEKMVRLHEEAFGVTQDKIAALGLPRLDALFEDEKVLECEKQAFYDKYPELKGQKLILYAPTFRDNDLKLQDMRMDLSDITEQLPESYYLLTKYHPFVCHNHKKDSKERVVDVSEYEDFNTLLFVADLLITDYSSIIYEYAILDKPMIFYAYDKEVYKNKIRGFYYDYEQYVPGKIVSNKTELVQCIQEEINKQCNHEVFVRRYLDYKDNKSSERIFNSIYKELV